MDDDDLVVVIVDEKGQLQNQEGVVFGGTSLDHQSLLDALQEHGPKVLKQDVEECLEDQLDVQVKVEEDYDENIDTVETLSEDGFKHEEYLDDTDEYMGSEEWHIPEETDDTQVTRQRKRPHHRYSLRKSDEQESYVMKLKERYPELCKDQDFLISTLVDTMKGVTPPELPEIVFIETDDGNLRFNCIACRHKSATVPAAQRHYQHTHGERYLVCLACGVDFRSTTTLYRHELRCIAPDATVVLKARALFVGGKARSRPYIPFDHTKREKAMKERKKIYIKREKFVCHLCPAVFRCKVSLVSHVHSHAGLRPYQCATCGAAYTSLPGLKKHLLRHDEPQFICDYCNGQFYTKSALTQHILSHLSIRRFACDECPSRYTQKKALVAHVRAVHYNLPLPCVCQICSKRFPYMTSLKVHMRHAHKMTMMTRHMFFKKLPTMPDADVVKYAKVILNSNDKEHARMRQRQCVVDDNIIELDDDGEESVIQENYINSEMQSKRDTIEFSKMMIRNMKQKLANKSQQQTRPTGNENSNSVSKKNDNIKSDILYVAPKIKPKTSDVKDVINEFDMENVDKVMYSKYMETIQRVKNYHKMQVINALTGEEADVNDDISTEENGSGTENTLRKIQSKEDEKGTGIQTLPQTTINEITGTSNKETNVKTKIIVKSPRTIGYNTRNAEQDSTSDLDRGIKPEENERTVKMEFVTPATNITDVQKDTSSDRSVVIKLQENQTTLDIEFVPPDTNIHITQNAKLGTSSEFYNLIKVEDQTHIDKDVEFVKPVKKIHNTRNSKRNPSNGEDGVVKPLKNQLTEDIQLVEPMEKTRNKRHAKRETSTDQGGALKPSEDQRTDGGIEALSDGRNESIANIHSVKNIYNTRKAKRDSSSDQDRIVIKSTKDQISEDIEFVEPVKNIVTRNAQRDTANDDGGVIKTVEEQTNDGVIKSVDDETPIVPPAKKINTRNAQRENSSDLDEVKKPSEKHTNVEAEVVPSVKRIHNARHTNRASSNHANVTDVPPTDNNKEKVITDLPVKNPHNTRNAKRAASNASVNENDVTMKAAADRNDVSVPKRGKKELLNSQTGPASDKSDADDEMLMKDDSNVESRNLESNYCKTRSKRLKVGVIEKSCK